jgi:hypothetical protein
VHLPHLINHRRRQLRAAMPPKKKEEPKIKPILGRFKSNLKAGRPRRRFSAWRPAHRPA